MVQPCASKCPGNVAVRVFGAGSLPLFLQPVQQLDEVLQLILRIVLQDDLALLHVAGQLGADTDHVADAGFQLGQFNRQAARAYCAAS